MSVLSDWGWDLHTKGKWTVCLTNRVNTTGTYTRAVPLLDLWGKRLWHGKQSAGSRPQPGSYGKQASQSRVEKQGGVDGTGTGPVMLARCTCSEAFFHNKWTDISSRPPSPFLAPGGTVWVTSAMHYVHEVCVSKLPELDIYTKPALTVENIPPAPRSTTEISPLGRLASAGEPKYRPTLSSLG